MAKQKLNKAQIDENVLRLLVVNEAIKTLQKELKGLKNNLESQYIADDNIREIISGIETEFEKIPVNNGAHNYDLEKVKMFTDAIGKTDEVVETVEVLDAGKLENLVKVGYLAPENLDVCRINKWTFKTTFRRKEEIAQDSKVSKEAVADVIEKVMPTAKPAGKSRTKKVVGQ